MRMNWTLVLVCGFICGYATAEKEVSIPVSDTAEGTRCDKDLDMAGTCFRCSRLPGLIAVQLTDCCMDDKAYNLCFRCVDNQKACLADAYSINRLGNYPNNDLDDVSTEEYEEYPDPDVSKRFGTVFMGPSRYGYPKKRYGMVFLGGKNKGGYGSYRYRGKRYGNLNLGSSGMKYQIGKRDDDSEEEAVDKRYGSFGLGNSRGLGYRYGSYGKRADDEVNEPRSYDSSDEIGDVDKRYGTLFMSRNGGRKRYGSLFLGKSRSWR